jgi:hypothetical protein
MFEFRSRSDTEIHVHSPLLLVERLAKYWNLEGTSCHTSHKLALYAGTAQGQFSTQLVQTQVCLETECKF